MFLNTTWCFTPHVKLGNYYLLSCMPSPTTGLSIHSSVISHHHIYKPLPISIRTPAVTLCFWPWRLLWRTGKQERTNRITALRVAKEEPLRQVCGSSSCRWKSATTVWWTNAVRAISPSVWILLPQLFASFSQARISPQQQDTTVVWNGRLVTNHKPHHKPRESTNLRFIPLIWLLAPIRAATVQSLALITTFLHCMSKQGGPLH